MPVIAVSGTELVMALCCGLIAGAITGLVCAQGHEVWHAVSAGGVAAAAGWGLGALLGAHLGVAGLLGVAAAAPAAAAASWLGRAGRQLWVVAGALALILLAGAYVAGLFGGPFGELAQARAARLSVQPVPEQYRFDGELFLRTRQLMKEGRGFYAAFRQAVLDDARLDETSMRSPFNFREPFLFYLWRLLPGALPLHLWYWFFLFSLVAILVAYFDASQLVEPGAALLAPVALVSYFTYFWWPVNQWFTFIEVWAGIFGLAAVALLLRGWRVASLVGLLLAVATREFMVLLVPAWVAAWWFGCPAEERKRTWWYPAVAVLGPALLLGIHVALAPVTPGPGGVGLATWLHGGFSRLIAALRFGWVVLPAGRWMSLAFPLAALIGAVQLKTPGQRAAVGFAILVPLVFLTAFSTGEEGFYWGAFFTPIAVALAPGALSRWLPARPAPSLS